MAADTRTCPRCPAMIWEHRGVKRPRLPGACHLHQAQCQAITDQAYQDIDHALACGYTLA